MSDLSAKQSEYGEYFSAKGWENVVSESHFSYFDQMAKRVNLRAGHRVLEVGFGSGAFLDWCRERKMEVVGIEILEDSLVRAKARGHQVLSGPLGEETLDGVQGFDAIAAFDVVEHMTLAEIRSFFNASLPHLKKDGIYVLRFPNGSSPVVGSIYFSDITHRTLLTAGSLETIVRPFGLTIKTSFNDRSLPKGAVAVARRLLSHIMRDCVETILGLAYFGRRLPMDQNLCVVLTRT
jgi:2-polyprenyl-3-methyl-5-hydroxy-6-metoxy-1,4-benzoquinol methylase